MTCELLAILKVEVHFCSSQYKYTQQYMTFMQHLLLSICIHGQIQSSKYPHLLCTFCNKSVLYQYNYSNNGVQSLQVTCKYHLKSSPQSIMQVCIMMLGSTMMLREDTWKAGIAASRRHYCLYIPQEDMASRLFSAGWTFTCQPLSCSAMHHSVSSAKLSDVKCWAVLHLLKMAADWLHCWQSA